ncbi:MAG TPA: cupin domain-containing protein [Nitriliruptorales bacterium]
MEVRRIVTGHDEQGRAVFVDVGEPGRTVTFEALPGVVFHEFWSTDDVPSVPHAGGDPVPAMGSFVPGPGGSRVRFVRMPADRELEERGEDVALARASEEYARKVPGLAETMEEDDPGMHATDTIDYGIVLSGRTILELDEGATEELGPGDVVIQTGTRHAWRNPFDEPCWMAFVMIGATRA